ncbi:MAG: response regulator, partial [Thermomicrobiales bacterium]
MATLMTTVTTKQKTVLIVDDETAISGMVAMALRYEGFSVAVAESGLEALEVADRIEPDVVVL